MSRDYLDFDVAIEKAASGYAVRVVDSPAGQASVPFVLPFDATELAQFMVAVGPPRVPSRRLMPAAARVTDVRDFGQRLNDALFAGPVGTAFTLSLDRAGAAQKRLRVRLRLSGVPELDPVPWEYLYNSSLIRFITLSDDTPIVRLLDANARPAAVAVDPPLRVLAMVSSPSDMPPLEVQREVDLLRATTHDLESSGLLSLNVIADATLQGLQRALIDQYHVFHYIGHGGFDGDAGEGVLVLERGDGTAHRVSGSRLGTLLHDAKDLQLAVLNSCEGARTSGRSAFSGVGQALVQQGLPAVVAMQTEISDRAALAFSHEFYYFLSRGLPIEGAMCEVRKAMATSDEASEWGTAVLLRSGAEQPFVFRTSHAVTAPAKEERWQSLYDAAGTALSSGAQATALPMLEQLAAEKPDYQDVGELLDRVRPASEDERAAEGRPGQEEGADDTRKVEAEGEQHAYGLLGAPEETIEHEEPGPPPNLRKRLLVAVGGLVAAALVVTGVYIATHQPEPTTPPPSAAELERACGPAATIPELDNSITLPCAVVTPQIDGRFEDWEGVSSDTIDAEVFPKTGATPEEFSAEASGSWDSDAMYLHARVTDPSRRQVNVSQPSQFFKGDGISFEFGPDPRDLSTDAGPRNGRDLHVMIGLAKSGPLAAINPVSKGAFRPGGLVPEITSAVERTGDGYEIETRVPWSALGIDSPARGSVFGMNFNVSDASPSSEWALGQMISSNPGRTGANQAHPGTWQLLVLADD